MSHSRKPLSLKHRVIIPGHFIDLHHTNVAETFDRVRREMAQARRKQDEAKFEAERQPNANIATLSLKRIAAGK